MGYFYKGKETNFKGLGWTGPVGFYGPSQLDADRQEMDKYLKDMESMLTEIKKRGGSAGSLEQVVLDARAKLTQIASEADKNTSNNFWLGTQGAYFKDAGPKIEQAAKDLKAKLDATPLPAPPPPVASTPPPTTTSAPSTTSSGVVDPSQIVTASSTPVATGSGMDPTLDIQVPADEPNLMLLGIGGFLGLFVLIILLVRKRKKGTGDSGKIEALEAQLAELRKKTGSKRKRKK